MKAFRACVLGVVAVLGSASVVAAADRESNPSMTVHYEGLNLSSTQGAAQLYARLQGAARQVCASFEGRELSRHAKWTACYNEALSRAVAQINQANVTALHARATQTTKES